MYPVDGSGYKMYPSLMTLKEYIETFPRKKRGEARAEIATACSVTVAAVKHWANGTRNIPTQRMRNVHKATMGSVSFGEMIPKAA